MLIDSHCHLDSQRFDGERAGVLTRARAAGVERFVTIGCDVENSGRALGLAAAHRDVFASVGIHPHEAGAAPSSFAADLLRLAGHPKCVAIGECGLDYYYDHSPREAQQRVFAAQIDLARRLKKPLIIHVRDAWDDCLALLAEQLGGPHDDVGVIHCFTGSVANADAALALGFYISIPGIVTFTKPGDLYEVVPRVPLERLLVETDSPYLAPAPYRGKRNEPAYVAFVAQKVAELRGLSTAELHEVTGANARRLFRLT